MILAAVMASFLLATSLPPCEAFVRVASQHPCGAIRAVPRAPTSKMHSGRVAAWRSSQSFARSDLMRRRIQQNDDAVDIASHHEIDRRRMIFSGLATASAMFGGYTRPALAEEDSADNANIKTKTEDPMAQLDAFTQQIGSGTFSQFPNSISPLPTAMQTPQDLVGSDDAANSGKVPAEAGMSDFDVALSRSARKRQVGPLTHG